MLLRAEHWIWELNPTIFAIKISICLKTVFKDNSMQYFKNSLYPEFSCIKYIFSFIERYWNVMFVIYFNLTIFVVLSFN